MKRTGATVTPARIGCFSPSRPLAHHVPPGGGSGAHALFASPAAIEPPDSTRYSRVRFDNT